MKFGNIGYAMDHIQLGHRMKRIIWGEQHIFWVAMDFYELLQAKVPEFSSGLEWNLSDWVAVKDLKGRIYPWVPTYDDLLADDWVEV